MVYIQDLINAAIDTKQSPDSLEVYVGSTPAIDYKLVKEDDVQVLEIIEGDYITEPTITLQELMDYLELENTANTIPIRHYEHFTLKGSVIVIS